MRAWRSLSSRERFDLAFAAVLTLPILAFAGYLFWTTIVRFDEEPVYAVLATLLLYFIVWPLQRFVRGYL